MHRAPACDAWEELDLLLLLPAVSTRAIRATWATQFSNTFRIIDNDDEAMGESRCKFRSGRTAQLHFLAARSAYQHNHHPSLVVVCVWCDASV